MPPPRRLDPPRRREHLLDTAGAWFATRPYDDVSMDAIARAAGVSRSLLYWYFPGKRDLFAAVYRRDVAALAERPTDPAATSLIERVASRLDLHLGYAAEHPHIVVAAHRVLRDDPLVGPLIDWEIDHLRGRILGAAAVDPAGRDDLAAVVTSWLAFVHTFVVRRLTEQALAPDEVRTICIDALRGALRGLGIDGIDGPLPGHRA